MKPLLVTSGEPAGIGPDLCLSLTATDYPCVVLGCQAVLEARAKQLGLTIVFEPYQTGRAPTKTPNHLTVLSLPCPKAVIPGRLDARNASYVLDMLTLASERCLQGEFSALVTAPVHKAIINQAGIPFTGHTEFFAQHCNVDKVVMMLASPTMKVALVTTHMPLKDVSNAITVSLLSDVIMQLDNSLRRDFLIDNPKIMVSGLNPHAGEGGFLGREEIEVIAPTLALLQKKGINVHGPFPADTMFATNEPCDAFVAMFHDQGLPVLKYAGFGQAVNVTLGLPIIRTSVDHGTALELAGTGLAQSNSLLAACEMAATIARHRLGS